MRVVFFILLLANLVVYLWHTQLTERERRNNTLPTIPADQQLELVSERFPPDPPPPEPEIQPVVVEPKEDVVEIELEPDVEDQDGADSALPDIEIVDQADTELTEDAEVSVAAAEELEPEPEQQLPVRLCYTLGPIKEPEYAKVIRRRLQNLGSVVTQRSKLEQEQYGYRVYLKPFATREEAVSETRKLAGFGIRDYYIITEETDHMNGISLGLFRKKSGAVRRMAQVRRFEFSPQMEIRYRDTRIYWLDFEHGDQVNSQPLWKEFAEITPELQRLDRECGPAR